MAEYPFRNDGQHEDFFTVNQWAKKGFLPKENAKATKMRPNHMATSENGIVEYYTAEDVRKASDDEIRAFFAPTRERQRHRRLELKEKRLKAEEEHKEYVSALESRIWDLRKVIQSMARLVPAQPQEIPAKAIVLDVETTGLYGNEEIMQLSIISADDEKTLYNSYFRPLFESEWKDAEHINGITPEMVAEAPFFYNELQKIKGIIESASKIIGYNVNFDLNQLKYDGVCVPPETEIVDVMTLFSPIYGEWNDYFGAYKWQKLTTCADYYNYSWPDGRAHDSLADCKATLFCYNKLKEKPAEREENIEPPKKRNRTYDYDAR